MSAKVFRRASFLLILVLSVPLQSWSAINAPSGEKDIRGLRKAFLSFQQKALEGYFGVAFKEFENTRKILEQIQEEELNPHILDTAVETALWRLDRAESLARQALPDLIELTKRFPPQEGDLSRWTPYGQRFENAKRLVRKSRAAAPVARLYREGLEIELFPCGGNTLAQYRYFKKKVLLRGYYGVNPIHAEYLAALLVHEGVHALQHRRDLKEEEKNKGEKRKRCGDDGLEDEVEANRIETLFWEEIGAPEWADYGGMETSQLEAYRQGEESFREYVKQAHESEAPWEWMEPETGEPDVAEEADLGALVALARKEGIREPEKTAEAAKKTIDLILTIRRRDRLIAGYRLKQLREVFEKVPEVLAPSVEIVNQPAMSVEAMRFGSYPISMRLGYGALTGIIDELDAARTSIVEGKGDLEELRRLRKDQEADPKILEFPGQASRIVEVLRSTEATRPLSSLFVSKGLWVGLFPWTDPKLESRYPNKIILPGRMFMKDPNEKIAVLWATHALAHRRQGLAPGDIPTMGQEIEALETVYALHSVFLGKEADSLGAYCTNHRFLFLSALTEAGPDVLRLYLRQRYGDLFPGTLPNGAAAILEAPSPKGAVQPLPKGAADERSSLPGAIANPEKRSGRTEDTP